MNTLDLLAQAAWKGTIVMAAGFAADWLLRSRSAALRHYLWTTLFGTLLVLPVILMIAPEWNLPARATATVVTVTGGAALLGVPAAPARPNPIPWIYVLGAVAVAIRFTAGAVRTRRLFADGVAASLPNLPPGVRVIESPSAPVPLVWGIFRPVIVLPIASRGWSPSRLRTVLLHELIHVQHRDLLAQIFAQAACCVYWFHPLCWIAAREQRRQRERACDDAVLRQGVAAPEYAGHLVDLVRGLTIAAPAMAEASDFEGRVRALLDTGRNRAPVTRRIAFSVAALACALILPIASVTSHAQASRGALAGVVTDPSGARVPNAEVRAKNLDGSNQETAVANAAGEYVFQAIPPGRYEIEVKVKGFKLFKAEAAVAAGTAARADASMDLGEVTETVTVTGAKAQAAHPVSNAANPQRIPIGGNVQPLKLLRQTRPEYPAGLQQQGVTGAVMIRAVIGTDGSVLNPQVVNTNVHPGLAQAALDAVRKWIYEPGRLNGQPVETATTITINFELGQ